MKSARQRKNVGAVTGDKATALKSSRRKLPTWPPQAKNWPSKKPEVVDFLLPTASRFPNKNKVKVRRSGPSMEGWEKKFGVKTARPARNIAELKSKQRRVRADCCSGTTSM